MATNCSKNGRFDFGDSARARSLRESEAPAELATLLFGRSLPVPSNKFDDSQFILATLPVIKK